MKLNISFILILSLLFLAACGLSTPTETQPPPATVPPTDTTPPTLTAIPSPTPKTVPANRGSFLPHPLEEAYNFVEHACEARWTNNGADLPCPGDLADILPGYVGLEDLASLYAFPVPALLTIPAQANSGFGGVFGHYPAFTVQAGDRFRAILACSPEALVESCDLEFALEYYDGSGTYVPAMDTNTRWYLGFDDQPLNLDLDLSFLAGQTVEFLLVVRDNGDPAGDYALWGNPHIWRASPDNTPTPPDATGVIGGMVDMVSAPPFLHDPILTDGTGHPVVVIAYNLDDGSFWWVHTSDTHPLYQMTVPAGRYFLLAYGPGPDYIPFPGAYTGQNPSCGEALQIVTVQPNDRLEGIDIADWCGYEADFPLLPPGIPIPPP